jgi:hypothetical protein
VAKEANMRRINDYYLPVMAALANGLIFAAIALM